MGNGSSGSSSAADAMPAFTAISGTPLYLTGEEYLRALVFNAAAGVTVKLAGRFQARDDARPRPFVTTLVPATDRSLSSTVLPLGEGWLLGAHVLVSGGTPIVGQTFAILALTRGLTSVAEDLTTLASGYITTRQRVAWPTGLVRSSLDGPGAPRSITGTDPAAGVEINETVPTGARWRPMGFDAALVTSAVAGNREVVLTIDDGTTIVEEVAAGVAQAASLTRRYSFSRGVPRLAPAASTVISAPMPDIWMLPGWRIRTSTTALDGGDNFGAPQLHVEEFLEG